MNEMLLLLRKIEAGFIIGDEFCGVDFCIYRGKRLKIIVGFFFVFSYLLNFVDYYLVGDLDCWHVCSVVIG